MTETQKRIKAYKEALPALRERVIAVALLLAMSASMLTSASFAWISLSTAPEVSGMSTTVAANGNLEIALAQGESMKNGVPVAAKEPNETAVGDSTVVQGIVKSNVTWGNLVNLSEPEYGVSSIALRPALLNNTNRNKYPLYGAKYGNDGRVENTTQRYEFTSYQVVGETSTDKIWGFAAGDKAKYGVRAISSVGYDASVGNAILDEYIVMATNAYDNVKGEYKAMIDPDSAGHLVLTSGRTCIAALEGLVGVFAQDKINSMQAAGMDLAPTVNGVSWKDKKMNCSMYIYDVYEMLLHMKLILEWEGEGLRQMANSQMYSLTPEGQTPNTNYFDAVVQTETSQNHLLKYKANELKALGINLVSYEQFYKNYNTILDSINKLVTNSLIAPVQIGDKVGIEAFSEANNPSLPEIHYADIQNSVNQLFDMNKTTIGGTKITSLSGRTALDILNKSDNPVVIGGGVLSEFEKRALPDSDARLNQRASVAVRAALLGSKNVKGVVTTESYSYNHVEGDTTYLTDMEATDAGGVAGAGEAVAKDTYGMAIDLWVRTNYPNAVLTLEGNVLTQQVHAQDAGGNYLYTLTVEDLSYDLYSANQNSGPYFYVSDDTEVTKETLDGGTLSIVYTDEIIGYEGENRIWSDEALLNMGQNGYLTEDSTSQGSGSCFVFYANSKPEQQKLLEMLESFTIAFIDEDGGRLGTAKLNTARKFENEGKTTVPLEIVSGVTYEEAVENSTEVVEKTGIMNLVQNQPTRVTAIVYLDGTYLQNQNVLAAGELTGQLNIQFGTNSVLQPPTNEELQTEYRTITVSAQSEDGQKWPEAAQITYANYDPDGHTITVNLNVDGVQPKNISGFFVRVIGAGQGNRLESVDFTPVSAAAEGEGTTTWTASFSLKYPGTYVLSDLLVDGMQYPLERNSQTKNHLTVFIPGLSLGPVTANPSGTIRTAESSYPIKVTAQVLSDVATPKSVTAHFYEKGNEYNQVIARLNSIGSNNWEGEALFTSSGTYILDSITVDGTSLDIPNKTEITFYMGMRCEVYNARADRLDRFTYEGDAVQVPVTVKIWDDTPSEVKNLSGVVLRYRLGNSGIQGTETEMTWNSAGYYTGTLNLDKPGTYTFQYLSMNLGSSMGVINQTDVSPTFRLNPKEPPAYVANSATAYATQLAIDSNVPATMTAKVDNAQTASVWAEMTKGEEKRYVSGTYSEATEIFTFTLNDLSDGTWTLTNLYAKNFTHANGTEYDDTDPNVSGILGFQLTGVNQVQTRIVKDVKVTATLDKTEYSGSFMEEHFPKLTVAVTDSNGNAINGISIAGGTWNVKHNGGQLENGGYNESYGDGQYAVPVTTAGVAQFADGSEGADELRTAGNYITTSLVVKLAADNGEASCNVTTLPSFTVKSSAPVLKVKSISPAQGTSHRVYTGTISNNGSVSVDTITGDFNRATDYSAVVYIYGGDNNAYNVYLPSVTLELTEMPADYTNASVTFGNKANASHAKTYTFTPSASSVTNNIGYGENGSWIVVEIAKPKIFPAGKQTVDKITVVYKDHTITVNLDNPVTINQPQYPYYADFASTSTTGVALNTTPSRIFAVPNEDGAFEITLPATQTWSSDKESSVDGEWVVQSGYPSTRYAYRTYSSWFRTRYVGYEEVTTVSVANSETTTWTENYKITGWKIGNNTYNPGDTVTIGGNQTVTAVVSTEKINEVTQKTVRTRTQVVYTETISETTTKPSGYVDGGWGSTAPKNKDDIVTTYLS